MSRPTPKPSDLHSCPGSCGVHVRRNLFACPGCWDRLPFDIRKAISTHYRRDERAHFAAMSNAIAWYRANPLPSRPEVIA